MPENVTDDPAPQPAHISEFLDGEQRDALVAALAFLATLQRGDEGNYFFYRVERIIKTISSMLYK